MKDLITEVGQPCRHCQTPVKRKTHAPDWKPYPDQWYCFDWWLKCPKCRAIYHQEEAKRILKEPPNQVDADYDARLEREA